MSGPCCSSHSQEPPVRVPHIAGKLGARQELVCRACLGEEVQASVVQSVLQHGLDAHRRLQAPITLQRLRAALSVTASARGQAMLPWCISTMSRHHRCISTASRHGGHTMDGATPFPDVKLRCQVMRRHARQNFAFQVQGWQT